MAVFVFLFIYFDTNCRLSFHTSSVERVLFRVFGDDINPNSAQSASKMVKSFDSPKNRDDNSNSLMANLTLAPLTYKLKL